MWLSVPSVAFQMSPVPDLDKLRWQNRVLVIFSPSEGDTRLQQENDLLEANKAGLAERDIKVFKLSGNSPETDRLRAKLGVTNDLFAVVLVGKDGSVKLRRREPTSPEDLFKIIDRMPMRKQEMRQHQS